MTNNKTNLIIQDRATGKTTQLICTSATMDYPIIVQNHSQVKFLLEKAKELNLTIPIPLTVEEFRNRIGRICDNVLIDEGYDLIGEALNHYLGTHVVAVTLTDMAKELEDKRIKTRIGDSDYMSVGQLKRELNKYPDYLPVVGSEDEFITTAETDSIEYQPGVCMEYTSCGVVRIC